METKSFFRDELKNITSEANLKLSQERFREEKERREKFNTLLETYFPCLLEKLKTEAQKGYYNYSLTGDEIIPYLETPEFRLSFQRKLTEYNLSLIMEKDKNPDLHSYFPYFFYIKWD